MSGMRISGGLRPQATRVGAENRAEMPKLLRDIHGLLSSGVLGIPVEKVLTNEAQRLQGMRKGVKAAEALLPRVRDRLEQRIREIDVVLRAGLLQPALERGLDTEKGALLRFLRGSDA